jgi:alkylation response protein AidB-like acyl-CoA dehydrogenase
MDLNYTAEDEAFRAHVRAWLEEHRPRKPLEGIAEQKAWHNTLHSGGFVGMGWPKEYGGKDARPMEQAILGEEMARVGAPGAINYIGVQLVGPTLIHHGTEAQKQRFIPHILSADELWCQLYSEPNAGSDLASLQCRADIDGDEFVINGQKIWTSGAQYADWGILLARTDRDAPKHQGISCILVDMHQPGVEVRPLKQISHSEEFSEVFFSNLRVPADNLVGELNTGWQIAQTTLGYERGGDTLYIVTRLQVEFERLIQVASTLRRDGSRAIDDPIIRQKLGQIYAETEVLRYASLRLLSHLEKGGQPGPESSLAKLHYSELDKRIQETVLDILGPYGQELNGTTSEYALGITTDEIHNGQWAYHYLWARAGTIYAGSSEIQKNIIGERVLGLPKEVRADRIAAAAAAKTP